MKRYEEQNWQVNRQRKDETKIRIEQEDKIKNESKEDFFLSTEFLNFAIRKIYYRQHIHQNSKK